MLRAKWGLSVSAALLLGAISITGCGANHSANDGNMQTKNVRGTDGRIHVNAVQNNRAGAGDNDFGSMEISRKLADRVAAMPEVRSANVIQVGRSVYVAVMLEDTSGGMHTRNTDGMTGRGTAAGTPGMTGTGGSMAGIPKNTTGTGTVGGTGRMTSSGRGTALTDADTLTAEVKNKIAAEVHKADRNIKNVYVSANPDFVERADYYAREFGAGHPLKGFANEFRVMVERIFPAHSGY
ncbi:YhcN/YlaJ family sporulation lipoprotein [Paenibacillus sp. FSL K6-1096]|uniref:YhcN/YlaJ family sporulation lipoprotein n=1 Tax=Paenibacillus sp. FSL K6-1096 TaxID=2921460 RepID=UPI0030ECD15B